MLYLDDEIKGNGNHSHISNVTSIGTMNHWVNKLKIPLRGSQISQQDCSEMTSIVRNPM